jgi:hypothetical protein
VERSDFVAVVGKMYDFRLSDGFGLHSSCLMLNVRNSEPFLKSILQDLGKVYHFGKEAEKFVMPVLIKQLL